MCAGTSISASSRLSANSSNHSARSSKRSFEPFLRSEGGLGDVLGGVLEESCDGDVEDELDNPGTNIGTKVSVLHINVFPSLVNRGF